MKILTVETLDGSNARWLETCGNDYVDQMVRAHLEDPVGVRVRVDFRVVAVDALRFPSGPDLILREGYVVVFQAFTYKSLLEWLEGVVSAPSTRTMEERMRYLEGKFGRDRVSFEIGGEVKG